MTKQLTRLLAVLVLIAAACGGAGEDPVAAPVGQGEMVDSGEMLAQGAAEDDATHDEMAEDHSEDGAAHDEMAEDHHEDGAAHDEMAEDHHEDEAAHDEMAEDHHEDEAAHDEMAEDHHGAAGGHAEDEYIPDVTGEPTRFLEIGLTEFEFEPDFVLVAAGETVRFTLVNTGTDPHEFRLSTAHRVEEHIAAGHDHSGTGGHHDERDIVVYLEAGETRIVDISFPEDTSLYTELVCLIEGHYEQGMVGGLRYES